ncbi:MAG: class I SAM-dependent methyltransferase [Chthoniobacterales bacterium]|nr:class I SAM-dependent methyltransferase [Chthoniobacterales bacterium]
MIEVDFISSFAPLTQFPKLADVCCGMGRHARALSKRGYTVTGVERDLAAVAKARELGGGPCYIEADLRDYQPEIAAYDAVIVMGQSFGHFDAAANRAVLGRLATGLRPSGRLILDLWHPEFFASHQGERDFELADGIVRETKRVRGDRLFVHLAYPTGEQEDFEWQLFSRTDMKALASSLGLTLVACCMDFDCSDEVRAATPRIQFVLERNV